MAESKRKIVIIGILLLGLVLRLMNLSQSFWLDEATQAQLSLWSVDQIWFNRASDFHPPLYYIFTHFWIQISHSEIWLRLPSVFFGVANIWLVYLFARKIFVNHKYAPYLSAFFMAVAPFHIYYSQEFRSYSLLCLLATCSMYFFYQKKYFSASIINSLMLYTHYSGIFLILTQIIYWLIYDSRQKSNFVLSQVLFFVLYIPWLPQFLRQLSSGFSAQAYLPGWSSVLSIVPLKAFPVIIFKIIAGRINFLSRYLYGLYIVFVFVVTFAGLFFAKISRRFLFTWLFVPIFLLMLVSLVLPQSQPFRVIFILPALVLLLTQVCLRFPKLFITLLVYIAIVGNVTYYTRPRLQREQWREMVTYIRHEYPHTPVAVKWPDRFSPLIWYASDLNVFPLITKAPATTPETTFHLQKITASQVLVLDYLGDLSDPNHVITPVLQNSGYKEVSAKDFPGVGIIRLWQRI